MNYPINLKLGDTIGICAPSAGLADEDKVLRLEYAIRHLEKLGYKVIETKSVRTDVCERSADAKTRAEEFMSLYEKDDVKLIICATGGDYLCEMLEYLDFDYIKTLKPKWIQGFSDITGLGFLFNSILDIPSMYSATIKSYAMKDLHRSLTDTLKIESGEEIIQNSFDKYEAVWIKDKGPEEGYNLTGDVKWVNVFGEDKVSFKGRAIGGCLDSIRQYVGTKYDNVKEYINRHKEDGIIWFLESFSTSTSSLTRTLWQLDNAGYFENCNGIIFGRPLFYTSEYEKTYNETVKEFFKNKNIPIVCDADVGHVSPQLAMVNGAILEIESSNGKGFVKTYLK